VDGKPAREDTKCRERGGALYDGRATAPPEAGARNALKKCVTFERVKMILGMVAYSNSLSLKLSETLESENNSRGKGAA
jgi:hypothetical protein